MAIGLILLSSLSFGLAIALTGWLKQRFSQSLLDIPNERSSHTHPTPRGGGLGFLLAFAIAANLAWGLSYTSQPILLAPHPGQIALVLIPLAIIGWLDDRHSLSARLRYWVQLAAAIIATLSFGTFPLFATAHPLLLGGVSLIFTLIGFTALVNFYNFMDGLDGLVASVTAVQLSFLALYLHQPTWWLLVAALAGFLVWNWSPAKIFMGDVGSTALGGSIAIALIANTGPVSAHWAALAITLPLTADAIYTLTRRLIRRENIFKAHRSHLYQRLQQSGWSHAQVAIAYLVWSLVLAGLISRLQLTGSLLSLLLSGIVLATGEYYLWHQTAHSTAE